MSLFSKARQDLAGVELPPPAPKTIDLEGRIAKGGVRKALKYRQLAGLGEGNSGVPEVQRSTVGTAKFPLRSSGQELNKAIDRAAELLQ